MKRIIYSLLVVIMISCKTDDSALDCSTVKCLAPSITIEILNTATNSNYILEKNITKEDIEVRNDNSELLDFNLILNNDSDFNGTIIVNPISSNHYNISIENLNTITLSFSVTVVNPDTCCSSIEIENLNVGGYPYEFNSTQNVLTINL